jgi:hypothetical protein
VKLAQLVQEQQVQLAQLVSKEQLVKQVLQAVVLQVQLV